VSGRGADAGSLFGDYSTRLQAVLAGASWDGVERLARDLLDRWRRGGQVFLCGNGGSAGNAMHLANDLLYGVGGGEKPGLRVHALPANSSVLTCLATD